MGERTSYENGTFNWVELATPDPAGRIAIAQDPQGAAFALFEGDVHP